jgi:two-component system chemotaxis response regulator CheB
MTYPKYLEMKATVDVLVVDDSALMRRIIAHLLESDPRIRVIGTASDGIEALEKVVRLTPDVVTLDVEMPRMNGIRALQAIMQLMPTPVVMLSGLDDADVVMQAFSLGAVDFVTKPSGTVSIDLHKIRAELISKVRLATLANLDGVARLKAKTSAVRSELPHHTQTDVDTWWYVVIGASTGGPQAVSRVLELLSPELPISVLVVQHMPAGFTTSFAKRLHGLSRLQVEEGRDGQLLHPGCAYIAPGGHHMVLTGDNEHPSLHLVDTPVDSSARPSVDVLMTSVAEINGPYTIGILLTGMGSDGVAGLAQIRSSGGYTMVQDEETCTIFGMPRVAIQQGVVDVVLPPDEMPAAIERVIRERTCG